MPSSPSLQEDLQNRTPVKGDLGTLGSLVVEPVQNDGEKDLWSRMVKTHHYLGFGRLFGHQIKYLARLGGQVVAALSFSQPAKKLRSRDDWMRWNASERSLYLHRIVNNSRFLILPDVEVPNLASAVLGRVLRRLPGDWEKRFGDAPWVVETFVDPSRYKGTSYRAAGFVPLGQTRGFGKTRKGYAWHGQPKEVYAFVLDPSFRSVVGLSWAPPAPPPSPIRTESWNPSSDVVLPSEADVEIVADELLRFHREFSEGFRTEATRRLGETYLFGLVSDLERKSVEPIAIALLGEKRVRGLQRFMTDRPWDEARVLELHRRKTAALIASSDPDLSMINADSSEFVKKGTESVGVARQYCGRLGKVENCQSGVFVGYAGPEGHALLAADLYLPRQWLSNDPEDPEREAFRERRKKTGVPDDTPFATKPERALEMIREVRKTGLFPARWVGVDATFGMDREFLRSLPPDLFYFAAIRSNTHVLLSPPRWAVPESKGSRGKKPTKPRLTEPPKKVSDLAETAVFTPTILKEGSQGPLGAHLSCLRVYRAPSEEGEAVSCEWLLLLKTPEGEMKYAFSNAPENTAPGTFARVSTLRWPIEQCFQEGKSFLGMGHYEHRSLRAWKRHMIYVFLAQLFYLRARLALQKKTRGQPSHDPDARRLRAFPEPSLA